MGEVVAIEATQSNVFTSQNICAVLDRNCQFIFSSPTHPQEVQTNYGVNTPSNFEHLCEGLSAEWTKQSDALLCFNSRAAHCLGCVVSSDNPPPSWDSAAVYSIVRV